jgi:hypothetical protein
MARAPSALNRAPLSLRAGEVVASQFVYPPPAPKGEHSAVSIVRRTVVASQLLFKAILSRASQVPRLSLLRSFILAPLRSAFTRHP